VATVIVVRHSDIPGTDPSNPIFDGWSNPALNEQGIKDAEALAEKFAHIPCKHVVTSDLLRTYQTAEILATMMGAKVEPTRTLRPWDYGMFTGQKETAENFRKLQYYVDHPDVPVPGGESFHTFAYRFAATFEKALLYARKHPDETVVLVTHSRNISLVFTILRGEQMNAVNFDETPDPAGFVVLKLKKDKWQVEK